MVKSSSNVFLAERALLAADEDGGWCAEVGRWTGGGFLAGVVVDGGLRMGADCDLWGMRIKILDV